MWDRKGNMKLKQQEFEKSLIKAKKVFRRSIDQRIYGREYETEAIKKFIDTGTGILNICGNPGSGKTFCVLKVLKNTNFLYVNCLAEENLVEEINNYEGMLVVIDEFDKFYMKKKGKCVDLLNRLKERGYKVITISNYLLFCDCSVVFKPYNYEDFVYILSKKIEDEIGEEIVEKGVIEFIARKHAHHGDIRKAFEFILKLINKKSKEVECTPNDKKGGNYKSKKNKFNIIHKKKLNKENEINSLKNREGKEYLNGEGSLISICDVMESENRNEEAESNVHKEIIKELIENNYGCSKIEVYKKYLIKCNSLNISYFDRNDFRLIYELLSD